MLGLLSPLFQAFGHVLVADAEQRAEDLFDRVILRWAGRAVGVVLLLVALVFGAVALFFWLETYWPPALAALVAAGVLLLLALVAFLVAARLGRARRPPLTPPALPARDARTEGTDINQLVRQGVGAAMDLARAYPGRATLAAIAAGLVVGLLTRGKD